jgi:HsdM N-terminal domain
VEQPPLNWIANYIWGIADDVLRDLYVRGKYRDVILPMTVLRRLDSLLEPTKPAVLEMKATLDRAGIVNQDQALRQAAGQAFYNTSKFTLRDLRNRASQSQLKADFEAYLNGFSSNVQEILEKFEFRNQIPRLSKADALGSLIEKLVSADVNLSPNPVHNGDGSGSGPGLQRAIHHCRGRRGCRRSDLRRGSWPGSGTAFRVSCAMRRRALSPLDRDTRGRGSLSAAFGFGDRRSFLRSVQPCCAMALWASVMTQKRSYDGRVAAHLVATGRHLDQLV